MTATSLAESYLEKCEVRREVLDLLFEREAWSDVVRESQELVELAVKGMLRSLGLDPPKVHELSGMLLSNHARFPESVDVGALARASIELRKHRELSFNGAEDLLPTQANGRNEAEEAIAYADLALAAARLVIGTRAE